MTQHIIVIMAEIITVKIYKAKSAKGKSTWEKSLEESKHKLPRVLFSGVTQDSLYSINKLQQYDNT